MIATTIKRIHLDQIRAGTKPVEYRACNEFWRRKITGKLHRAILFLCGPIVEMYTIEWIEIVYTPVELRNIIPTVQCYAIRLGGGALLGRDR